MATTTASDAATCMRALWDAVIDQDLDRQAEYLDDESVDVFHTLGSEVRGRAEIRAFFAELFQALDGFEFEIEEILPAGDDAAVGRWRIRGTFSGGPFQGIEPTGRDVDLRGIDLMRFEDGILRRNDVYYDGLTFARQIGLLPAADSAADKGIRTAFNAVTRARRALQDQFG